MSTSSLSKSWQEPARPGIAAAISAAWRHLLRRLAERQALRQLAQVDPRLIRDMGLDPDQIRQASGDHWEIYPATGWMHRPTDKN